MQHVMSPAPKPAQEEATVTDSSPSETSNPPSEDTGHEENKENKPDWKENLGYCTEEFLEQMLQNTTQYFPNCIKSENRAYPQQHCQKQLFLLHLRWLRSRTCADIQLQGSSGNKFTNIDCKNMTPHVYLTPHCQNQNPSKRKIQDAKQTAIMILYVLLDLLKFWCYGIKYAVNCLNHTLKKGLS
eukprot:6617698-Ditylum_brightwellii.AAC.1